MERYKLGMVPGPTLVPNEVLNAGKVCFGSPDMEKEYLRLYESTSTMLKKMMKTKNDMVIQTGEGMLALWSALKSTLLPNDRVLAISTGLFGSGFGEMATSMNCEVKTIGFGYDETIYDLDIIERAIQEFKPKMITMVHGETPSGTMNPIDGVAALKEKYNVPLLCVDSVSIIGGAEVKVDEWNIDLCLGATQKCLSSPANLAFLSVSDAAWNIIEEVEYAGYDSLLPFKDALKNGYFPYTPYWQGLAELHKACELILEEGLENVFTRHLKVASYCRERALAMNLKLYPVMEAVCAPTVTAIYVPENFEWKAFDLTLRADDLVVGGNYGCLAGEVFRIGHMGSQANLNMVKETMDIIENIVK